MKANGVPMHDLAESIMDYNKSVENIVADLETVTYPGKEELDAALDIVKSMAAMLTAANTLCFTLSDGLNDMLTKTDRLDISDADRDLRSVIDGTRAPGPHGQVADDRDGNG